MWAAPCHGLGSRTTQKGERELSTNIHFFPLLDCGYKVTRRLRLMPPHLSLHRWSIPLNCEPNPHFTLKLHSVMFCPSSLNHITDTRLNYGFCWKPGWSPLLLNKLKHSTGELGSQHCRWQQTILATSCLICQDAMWSQVPGPCYVIFGTLPDRPIGRLALGLHNLHSSLSWGIGWRKSPTWVHRACASSFVCWINLATFQCGGKGILIRPENIFFYIYLLNYSLCVHVC